jgi:hypothetical protein
MPSLDTQYGLDASGGPPCASGSESLPPARALLASRDVTQAHKHQLERLIDRLPKRFRAVIRWLRRPPSRWPTHPGDATPRLVSARLGRAAAADLARSCLGLDRLMGLAGCEIRNPR